MIRLQDIADMAGVSRTTVSNVIHGKTKKVSQETIDKIKQILEEHEYVPNMGSIMLSGKGSKIIGFVLGYEQVHGYPSIMDSFICELLAGTRQEAEKHGYYVMIIGGEREEQVIEIASRWSVEGLIFIGFNEKRYDYLRKKLNKKAVLIDTYPENNQYDFQNVGINDYNGGYQIGAFLKYYGYKDALFLAEETRIEASGRRNDDARKSMRIPGLSNEWRWKGFREAMEKDGSYCSVRRYVVADQNLDIRMRQYEELLPVMLKAKAVACASDYNAIELINFLHDKGISVPGDVSITGFDDCMYCEYVRPRLTTIHQDVEKKGKVAVGRLIDMLEGRSLEENNIQMNVHLVVRDSVKMQEKKKTIRFSE